MTGVTVGSDGNHVISRQLIGFLFPRTCGEVEDGEKSRGTGLLHEVLGEGGVEGRKRESAVAIDLDKLSTGIKQDHRAKL